MKNLINRIKRGFTLVELAIVIAVIAILVAVLVPTFIALIDQAQESKDSQMIYNINTALSLETNIETPEQALAVAEEAGYNLDKLTPSSDSEIFYDQVNTRFIIKFSDGTVYPSSAASLDLNTPTVWHFVSTNDLTADANGVYTISADYSVIITNKAATATESDVQTAQTAKTSITTTTAATAEESVASDITISYTGKGFIDTSKANNVATVEYKYTGSGEIDILLNVHTTIIVDFSEASGTITITNYGKENGDLAIRNCGNVSSISITDKNGASYICDSDKVTVTGKTNTCTVSENIIYSTDGTLELGTENNPYLISSEDDFAKINYGGYCIVTSEETISSTGTLTVNEGITATLDLNGKTITSSASKTIDIASGATLTITDSSNQSGSVENTLTGTGVAAAKLAHVIYNAGTLCTKNVKILFKGTQYGCCIYNTGTANINGSTLEGEAASTRGVYNKGNLEIMTATIEISGKSTYAVYNSGNVIINDGIMSVSGVSSETLNNSSGTLTINGGTFSGSIKTITVKGEVEINGGNIENTSTSYSAIVISDADAVLNVSGSTSISARHYGIQIDKGTANINGGTIKSLSYGIYMSNGEANITGGSVIVEATDGITENGVAIYATGSSSKVNVSGNVTVSASYSGSSLSSFSGAIYGMYITTSATATISNSEDGGSPTITATSTSTSGQSIGICTFLKSTLTVTGGTISGGNFGISGNGASNDGTTISISNAKVESTAGTAIFHPQAGELTIEEGSVIVGKDTGIEMRSGTLTVNGGEITGSTDDFYATANDNGNTVIGAAIAISQHTTNNDLTVIISGGTLTGYYAVYEEDLQDETVYGISVSITNGTFNGYVYSENIAIDTLVSGYTYSYTNLDDGKTVYTLTKAQ